MDITKNVYYECFLSSLSTKTLKPTNNTLYLENKKKYRKIGIFFSFLLFIIIGTEMPKFCQNSGNLCGKKDITKKVECFSHT